MASRYSETVNFRCSPSEKSQLVADAKTSGLSLSDYVRSQVIVSTTATPQSVVAAANYLSNTLPSIENAVREARSILEQGKKGA